MQMDRPARGRAPACRVLRHVRWPLYSGVSFGVDAMADFSPMLMHVNFPMYS